MTVPPITTKEIGSSEHELSQDQADALNSSEMFAATKIGPGRWRVRLRRQKAEVGSVRVGHLDVHIAPKLPIKRVLFLLGYAAAEKQRIRWQPDTVGLKDEDRLVPAFAHLLWRRAEAALAPGVLTGYVAREATSTVLRGRVRETDQLYRSHGLGHPLQIRYDDLTPDITENQILKAALSRMLGVPGVDAESRRVIRRQLRLLSGVSKLPPHAPPPSWTPTRLNMRYAEALTLSELVLKGRSAEHGKGRNLANGFLVDMEDVFEDFIHNAVGRVLRRLGGGWHDKPTWHLDATNRLKIEPDLVWTRGGHPVAVADAKYKRERPKLGGDRDDIFQMIAYCMAKGVRHGHLIYAAGHAQPKTYTIGPAQIQITCHALDLDQDPGLLLAQVQRLAEAIARPILAPDDTP